MVEKKGAGQSLIAVHDLNAENLFIEKSWQSQILSTAFLSRCEVLLLLRPA
jgi:hypothetical protein